MKMPSSCEPEGGSPPLAFFLHSGSYSSFVLSAVPREEDGEDILAPMTEGNLWDSDCVQLTDAAVFLSVGSDAINQPIWVYLDASGKAESPARSLDAMFLSRGEQVYLECLIDMTYGTYCDQFFLPKGEYKVRFLSWNLERAHDNFDANPALFLEYSHHELHFTTTTA